MLPCAKALSLVIVAATTVSCERGPGYLYNSDTKQLVACYGSPMFGLTGPGDIDRCINQCRSANFRGASDVEMQIHKVFETNRAGKGYKIPLVCQPSILPLINKTL